MKGFVAAIGASLAVLAGAEAQTNQPQCEALLYPYVTSLKQDNRMVLAWLETITKDNYEAAKRGGSALVPGLFEGDYESFDQKRSRLNTRRTLNLETYQYLEYFKTGLTSSQTKDYVDCVNKRRSEIAVAYSNVTDDAATLTIYWDPERGVAPLRKVMISPTGGTVDNPGTVWSRTLCAGFSSIPLNGTCITSLDGSTTITLKRSNNRGPILGTVNGVLDGSSGAISKTATFFVPGVVNEPPPPPKYVTLLRPGVQLIVRARWAGSGSTNLSALDDAMKLPVQLNGGIPHLKSSRIFHCTPFPLSANQVPIFTATPRIQRGGERARNGSGCVDFSRPRNRNLCNGLGEYCDVIVSAGGCVINGDWVDWYVREQRVLGASWDPYSKNWDTRIAAPSICNQAGPPSAVPGQ